MKAFGLLLLALPLLAAEPENTEWYDAEGKLVLVEGPDAEPAEVPFVAEWRKREIERRERTSGSWSSEMWPVWGNGYGVPAYAYPAYRVRGRWWGGVYRHRAYPGVCRPIRAAGPGVIIRW